MDLKSTYNKIAENWEDKYGSSTWWHSGVNKFISFLGENVRVLDVGCGTGVKSKYLTDKGLDVVGIDFAEKMIDIARAKVPAGNFLVMDLKDINQLEEKFDGIFAQAVLLHFPKKEIVDILKIFRKSLKPGGYLYITVKEIRMGEDDEQTITRKDYGHECERFFSFFILDEMLSYLKRANFKVVYRKIFPGEKKDDRNLIQIIAKR